MSAEGRASANEVIAALRTRIPADRVVTAGPEFDAATALWNGAVTSRPRIVVGCAGTADVQAAVAETRRHGWPLSVRGPGHGWAGQALRDGGVTLDLTRLRTVRVDAWQQSAEVGGGASSLDVQQAAEPAGLTAVTGTVGGVGFAGLTLGGGYGPLMGRFGLAADNLLAAEVVLADGSVLVADPRRDAGLYWALRGGGGNFGVVTRLWTRLHRIPAMMTGRVVYPAAQAEPVLAGLLDGGPDELPDELTVQTAFVRAPSGDPVLALMPTWCGPEADGADPGGPVGALSRLGTPLMAAVGAVSPAAILAQRDAMFPRGRHVAAGTRWLPGLPAPARDVLIEQGTALTSPFSAITLHHLHGAAARVPGPDTAFGLRTPHLMSEVLAIWPAGEPGDRHRQWAARTSAALAPYARPGGYPNMLGPADGDQIPDAYGPNAGRLLQVKQAYDPDGVFTATPLPHPRVVTA